MDELTLRLIILLVEMNVVKQLHFKAVTAVVHLDGNQSSMVYAVKYEFFCDLQVFFVCFLSLYTSVGDTCHELSS